jgi:hypothetical protein
MDIAPVLRENSRIQFERLRVVGRFDESKLSNLRRGIIFVFALWPGGFQEQ